MLAKGVASQFLREPDLNGVKIAFHFVSPDLPTGGNYAEEYGLSRLRLAKVASDLLYVILQQDGSLFEGCKAELRKLGDRFFTNPSSLWRVLRKAIKDCKRDPIYILVDGLDALVGKSHKELMERILDLMKIRTVKIFLSSRDVPYISNNLRCGFDKYEINLDMTNFVRMDVETFIKRRVDKWRWDVVWREKAMETLIDKSEGIFLWVSLAIDNLTDLSSGPDFREWLKKPQSGLKEVYQKMLHSLNPELASKEVLNMIRSVALALRPLTFSELGYILACTERKAKEGEEPIGRRTSSEIQPKTENDIRCWVKSSMGFLRATKTTVCIVHPTAIEYLFCANCGHGLPGSSIFETELTISWKCFQYLHDVFEGPEGFPSRHHNAFPNSSLRGDHKRKEPEETPREVPQKTPREAAVNQTFLPYAAESWLIHPRHSIETSMHNFYNDSTRNWPQYQFPKTSDTIRKPWINPDSNPNSNPTAHSNPNSHPNAHYVNPNAYYANPNTHYANPNAHYVNPNAYYANPNTHYANPNAHYANPNTHYANPNAHYANPNSYPNAHANPNNAHANHNSPSNNTWGRNNNINYANNNANCGNTNNSNNNTYNGNRYVDNSDRSTYHNTDNRIDNRVRNQNDNRMDNSVHNKNDNSVCNDNRVRNQKDNSVRNDNRIDNCGSREPSYVSGMQPFLTDLPFKLITENLCRAFQRAHSTQRIKAVATRSRPRLPS